MIVLTRNYFWGSLLNCLSFNTGPRYSKWRVDSLNDLLTLNFRRYWCKQKPCNLNWNIQFFKLKIRTIMHLCKWIIFKLNYFSEYSYLKKSYLALSSYMLMGMFTFIAIVFVNKFCPQIGRICCLHIFQPIRCHNLLTITIAMNTFFLKSRRWLGDFKKLAFHCKYIIKLFTYNSDPTHDL